MEHDKLKKIVEELLNKKVSLSEIQKILNSEYKETITFLELKLLLSELENVKWEELEPESEKKEELSLDDVSEQDKSSGETCEFSAVSTVVEISKLARPGAALSGSVKFASGATADWVVDQLGRLSFENAVGKPTEEDIKEFQEEIQKKVGGG